MSASPNKVRVAAAIEDLIRAEVADSWKGGGDPRDIPLLEKELAQARAALVKLLDEVMP